MFQGALIVFAIFFIIIAACILPWWFLPGLIVYFTIVELLKRR